LDGALGAGIKVTERVYPVTVKFKTERKIGVARINVDNPSSPGEGAPVNDRGPVLVTFLDQPADQFEKPDFSALF